MRGILIQKTRTSNVNAEHPYHHSRFFPVSIGAEMYAVIIFLLLAFTAGCEKNTNMPVLEIVSENEPDQLFSNARMILTEDGITSAILQAKQIKIYMDSSFTAADGGIQIDFYNKEGEHISKLTAESSELWGLYEEVDSLKTNDNIVIVSTEGDRRMETAKSLIWLSSTREIYADGLVKLISGDSVEQGYNFVANDDLSEYRMENVSGSFGGADIKLPGR